MKIPERIFELLVILALIAIAIWVASSMPQCNRHDMGARSFSPFDNELPIVPFGPMTRPD
jgi:hypothetical protein